MAVSDALALTVPALLAGVGLYGALTGTDVFSALTAGALDGLKTVVRIFPALVALLAAVFIILNTVVDISYLYLDPRIRKAQGGL